MLNILLIILGIIGCLIMLVFILMLFPLTAKIEYKDDFEVKVKYLFIKLYPRKSKSKSKSQLKKKNKKKSKLKKQTDQIKKEILEKQSGEKLSLNAKVVKESGLGKIADDISKGNQRGFDFETLKLIYDAANPPLRRLIRKVRIERLYLDCTVGGDDAAKVAVTYGFQSAAISSGLAWLNEILTLKIKKVNVRADFAKEKTQIQMRCKVKVRVLTILTCYLRLALVAAKNPSLQKVLINK